MGSGGFSSRFSPWETNPKGGFNETNDSDFSVRHFDACADFPAATRAQAEHAPDNYGVSNTAPMTSNPPAKTDFQGTFSLDEEAQCACHKLTAGIYTILVKTVGENKMVTLQRDGKDIVLTVRKATPPMDSGHSAVLVRHGPGPGGQTVEAIYVESLNLVLFLDESGCTKQMDKMFVGMKRTPIQ